MVLSCFCLFAILFSDEQDSGISVFHYGVLECFASAGCKPIVEKSHAKRRRVEEYQHTSCDYTEWNPRAVLRKMLCSPQDPQCSP